MTIIKLLLGQNVNMAVLERDFFKNIFLSDRIVQ